ncbi:MAG: hypothetical protein V4649_12125 [Bacteroidota bacterium]
MRITLITIAAVVFIVTCIASCIHKPQLTVASSDSNFPADVAKILVDKCAIDGCHNSASYQNSRGLLLDTWDHLFDGSVGGAAVVPYSPAFSPLLYFVNTDSSRGPVARPLMPESRTSMPATPLSETEYNTLRTWIAAGAPDKNGNVPFASNPFARQKIYVTQQGCDLLAVIDAESNVVMRYIPIGMNASSIESPHSIRMSSDGRFAYVSFLAGTYIQKIDTRLDTVVASMQVGAGSWNILHLAPADTALIASDWTANGKLVFGNTASMELQPWKTASGSGLFVYPHGITSTAKFDTCFITAQYGNMIYRYAHNIPNYKKVSINGKPPIATSNSDLSSPNPHEIIMSPDYNKVFITCQGTNEVRVLDAHTNAVLDSIPTGAFPQEMAVSLTKPYLFVTCSEDAANTTPGRKGSVYVINYNTHEIVAKIYGDFYQPHAIAIDDINSRFYVVSTNANPLGPPPHHATACGGRAGWYSVYDLNRLQPVNTRQYQLTVMPYAAVQRFRQ